MATGIPCYKIILCGEYGVGKSSLFRRFVDNSFTEQSGPRSTIGLDHFSKVFNRDGRQIKLELWDTAGIERFATLSASYFKSCTAAILCYAINNRDSFALLSQHLLEIVMHTETAKVFLCGNKTDLSDREEVSLKDIEDLRIQCDTALSGTFRVSCKNDTGVSDMFDTIASSLIRDGKQEINHELLAQTRLLRNIDLDSKDKSQCCSSSNNSTV